MAIITKMANFATIHLRFVEIEIRWPTRHVDNCEFYEKDQFGKNLYRFGKKKVWENWLLMISENSNFVKNGEFGKSLSKVWEKLKQDDKRRMSLIVGSY